MRIALLAATAAIAMLTSCSTGPVRRVSEPAASLQQLQVRPDGNWSVDLRLHNYSSIPMQFKRVQLQMSVDGQPAANLDTVANLQIGPESPDLIKLTVTPTLAGKIAVADSLTRKVIFNFRLQGTVMAAPEKAGERSFKINSTGSLSPAPGLDGVLR
ncbi:hypothetical protein V3390_09130 [Luteimonas sp. FXH3W]|uniref:Late embryogenesis abundant protein n=1 Tax=Aquilutibacter rugosus TaxID=3115820 RepID=A0ABU7V3H4_9GAMM